MDLLLQYITFTVFTPMFSPDKCRRTFQKKANKKPNESAILGSSPKCHDRASKKQSKLFGGIWFLYSMKSSEWAFIFGKTVAHWEPNVNQKKHLAKPHWWASSLPNTPRANTHKWNPGRRIPHHRGSVGVEKLTKPMLWNTLHHGWSTYPHVRYPHEK